MFARGFHARRWHCPRACGEAHLVPIGVSRDPEVFEISAPWPGPSSESEVATPRVLPDLRTAAGETKREDVRQPRRNGAANRSTEGQPRKKVSAKPLRVPAAGTINEPAPALYFSDHAEAAMALTRRMNASRTKLPPGERWRERRLPSVCWGRGRRKRGSAVTVAASAGRTHECSDRGRVL